MSNNHTQDDNNKNIIIKFFENVCDNTGNDIARWETDKIVQGGMDDFILYDISETYKKLDGTRYILKYGEFTQKQIQDINKKCQDRLQQIYDLVPKKTILNFIRNQEEGYDRFTLGLSNVTSASGMGIEDEIKDIFEGYVFQPDDYEIKKHTYKVE